MIKKVKLNKKQPVFTISKKILKIGIRYINMLIIAFYYLIMGYLFATLNNAIFPTLDEILIKYENENDGIGEVVGWCILELMLLIAEIYLIRNIGKRALIYLTVFRNTSILGLDNSDLSELILKEMSDSIMLGYTLFLFNYGFNDKLSWLIGFKDKNEKSIEDNDVKIYNLEQRIIILENKT